MQPDKENEKTEFQPVELCLEIDLVSHTIHGGRVKVIYTGRSVKVFRVKSHVKNKFVFFSK